MRRIIVLCSVAALWAVAVAAVVFAVDATNSRWPAEVGYLVVAAVIVAVWEATDVLLRKTRLQLPYRPE